mmetsp:Transcript_114173/g.355542  ORF Transcript_114173/g.355542 Transcript_114173/m.355542 type:complete len:375 (-) Transcript_114173:1574-2698(-)
MGGGGPGRHFRAPGAPPAARGPRLRRGVGPRGGGQELALGGPAWRDAPVGRQPRAPRPHRLHGPDALDPEPQPARERPLRPPVGGGMLPARPRGRRAVPRSRGAAGRRPHGDRGARHQPLGRPESARGPRAVPLCRGDGRQGCPCLGLPLRRPGRWHRAAHLRGHDEHRQGCVAHLQHVRAGSLVAPLQQGHRGGGRARRHGGRLRRGGCELPRAGRHRPGRAASRCRRRPGRGRGEGPQGPQGACDPEEAEGGHPSGPYPQGHQRGRRHGAQAVGRVPRRGRWGGLGRRPWRGRRRVVAVPHGPGPAYRLGRVDDRVGLRCRGGQLAVCRPLRLLCVPLRARWRHQFGQLPGLRGAAPTGPLALAEGARDGVL